MKFPTPKPLANENRDDLRLWITALTITLLTSAAAIFVWAQTNGWQLTGLSAYQLFPLFGLLAFSVMWSQYVVEAIKNISGQPQALKTYFQATGWIVLITILLHPGLLVAQRFRDGYGLPPGSYLSYVAPLERWVVFIGTLSLLMFLAFELKRRFSSKSWWKYIIILNDVAIIAIYYHGLRLGSDLSSNWFRGLWYMYGAVLLAALIYKYWYKLRLQQKSSDSYHGPV